MIHPHHTLSHVPAYTQYVPQLTRGDATAMGLDMMLVGPLPDESWSPSTLWTDAESTWMIPLDDTEIGTRVL